MRHLILLILLFVTLKTDGFCEPYYIFKYLQDDGSYNVVVSPLERAMQKLTPEYTIAKRLINIGFYEAGIPKNLYKVSKIEGIAFYGDRIYQYDVTPIKKDRFAQTFWVDEGGNVIKTEIFDVNGKLVLAFNCIDIDQIEAYKGVVRKKDELSDKEFMKGFHHESTKTMSDGSVHLVFKDGLNNFSVFISPFPRTGGVLKKMVFGHYTLTKVFNGFEYTVLGSIPYELMDEVIEIFADNRRRIMEAVEKGEPITESVYQK